MYSRARILGHPIHPMLISLPITSFVFALISLIAFAGGGGPFWLGMTYWLAIAGVICGLIAAVPGLIDQASIPADAAARPIATRHMILNVLVVALYFVAWLILGGFKGPAGGSVAAPLVLEIIGAVLLVNSGWLGWEMVYRHHVAVEPMEAQEREIVELHERRRAA